MTNLKCFKKIALCLLLSTSIANANPNNFFDDDYNGGDVLDKTSYHGKFNRAEYNVCFTPGADCTTLIVNKIDEAKKSIYMQAYSFTSGPIAKALANAKHRGLDVKIILDKSDTSKRYFIVPFLVNNSIPVWIDYKPAIAHNKIIIIDNETVIGGSFNYTKAAQHHNAENVLIIHDKVLAEIYKKNWNTRLLQSYRI